MSTLTSLCVCASIAIAPSSAMYTCCGTTRATSEPADVECGTELDTITGKTLLSMAVMLGKTRLIDNFVLG